MKKADEKGITALKVLAFAATLGLGMGAQAEEFKIQKGDFSGSFITSYLTYRPGERTVTTTAAGYAVGNKFGKFQSHTITEFNTSPDICEPPTEDPFRWERRFYVVKSNVVLTFEKGQLYLKAQPATRNPDEDGCVFLNFYVDPVVAGEPQLAEIPGGFELTVEYKVVGGSGEFAGAQGDFKSITKGTALEYNDNSSDGGDNWFGGVAGTIEGSFCTDCSY